MFTKRKYSSLFADYEQQENAAAGAGTSAGTSAKQLCQPKSPLVESLNSQNTSSMFVNSWQKLSNSKESPRTSHWDNRQSICSQLLNTSSPGMTSRSKALPICRLNSSNRPASKQRGNRDPASHRKISELWRELSEQSLNGLSNTDTDVSVSESDDSYIDSLPVTQVAPESTQRQYLPSGSCKKAANSQRMPRCVKGGYVEEFRKTMKRVRMDRRHLSNRAANHKVHVLDVSKEFGVHMARVEPVAGTSSGDSTLNILLHTDMADAVRVGSRLEFYLHSNKKPLQLRNKQWVYSQPHNIVIL